MNGKYCTNCRWCQKTGHTPPPGIREGDWRGWLCVAVSNMTHPVTGRSEGGPRELCVQERTIGTRCGPEGELYREAAP